MPSARAKAAKNRQRIRNQEQEIERRLRVTEEQDNEVEALRAIYGNDFRSRDDLECFEITRAFEVTVWPFPGQVGTNHSSVTLEVKFPREYPSEIPLLKITEFAGVGADEVEQMEADAKEQCEKCRGEPVIFVVISGMQEFLVPRNRESLTVYEQMIRNNEEELQRQFSEDKQNMEMEERRRIEAGKAQAQLSAVENLSLEEEAALRHRFLATLKLGDGSVGIEALDTSAATATVQQQQQCSSLEQTEDVDSSSCTEEIRRLQAVIAHLLRVHDASSMPLLLTELANAGVMPAAAAANLQNSVFLDAELDASGVLGVLPAATTTTNGDALLPEARSRYRSDFREIQLLGRGSYGRVMKVQNRLDGRFYAVKIIQVSSAGDFRRILREVTTLSRLSHPYVLRYYNAWLETSADGASTRTLDAHNADEWDRSDTHSQHSHCRSVIGGGNGATLTFADHWALRSDSVYRGDAPLPNIADCELSPPPLWDASGTAATGASSSYRRPTLRSSSSSSASASPPASVYQLFIQTEFCELDLRATITREAAAWTPEEFWRRFRQIVEGLAHIHGQGIVHRDLKPSNIFLQPGTGDVRIGDLGLATQPFSVPIDGGDDSALAASANQHQNDEAMMHTTAVGTFLYTAPEQLVGVSLHYDEKVDIYALGIVMFEMIYPLKTAHERVAVLKRLRQAAPEFPAAFEEAHPRQARIIRWLLQAEPSQRPSALELLQSTLLPPKLEDDFMKDALRTLSDPNTPFYHRLLGELFNAARPMPWCSSASPPIPPPPPLAAAVHNCVLATLQAAFEAHSGVHYSTPLLSRITDADVDADADAALLLMDREGHLVRARSDLRRPLARCIAQTPAPVQPWRVFEVAPVFRCATADSGAPLRQVLQADFDIVDVGGEEACVCDAELLALLQHVLVTLALPFTLVLGHASLTNAVLDACDVPMQQRGDLLRCVAPLVASGAGVENVREALASLAPLPATCVGALSGFLALAGAPKEMLAALQNAFVHNRAARAGLDELGEVLALAEVFGVAQACVRVAPLVAADAFYSGVLVRVFVDAAACATDCVTECATVSATACDSLAAPQCIGVGGRYCFARTKTRRRVAGAGVSLAVQQLCELVCARQGVAKTVLTPVLAHCSRVFVASVGANVYSVRLAIAGELWAHGVSAALASSPGATLQQQVREAETRRAHWLLTVKEKYYECDGTVRVRRVDRRQDMILARDEVIKFFKGQVRRK